MLASVVFQCLSLLWIISKVADVTLIQVMQRPKHIAINRGEDVTFSCNFSRNQRVKIYWWKQGASEYMGSSHKKTSHLEASERATLKLLDAELQDSGTYYCTMVFQGNITVNGSGSHLTVYVPPIPLNISSEVAQGDSSVFLTLVCKTAAFYPENLTFTWFKTAQKLQLGYIPLNDRTPRDCMKLPALWRRHSLSRMGQFIPVGCLTSASRLQEFATTPSTRFTFLTKFPDPCGAAVRQEDICADDGAQETSFHLIMAQHIGVF
eukprot:gi/632972769/ref/XP_007902822.1/ PREDICTED: opioid-binding protein/cell adhesion molecule homolog [Callorhinchus milii]